MNIVRLPSTVYKTFDTLETKYPIMPLEQLNKGELTSDISPILTNAQIKGKDNYDEYTSGGRFDINKFNKQFTEKVFGNYYANKKLEEERLQKLNQESSVKPLIHQLSIGQIFINMMNTIFYLLTFNFNKLSDNNNTLFYLAFFILIITIISIIYLNLIS